MSAPLVLGLDVGTTAAKAILVDSESGAIVASATQEYPTLYPHPGWAEQDPELWWQACATIIGQVIEAAGRARVRDGALRQLPGPDACLG